MWRRANLVWGGLVLAALGYGTWQLTKMLVKRSDPNTSLTISNGVFNFPHVTVCLHDGLGCGFADGSTEGCVVTAKRFSYAYVESSEHDASDEIYPTEADFENCVKFDLSGWDKVRHQVDGRPRAFVQIFWISSDDPSAETDYSTGVEVFVGGDIGGEEYTTVPYSRTEQPADEAELATTVMTIGKTRRKNLGGDSTIVYPVLTTTTTNYFKRDQSVMPLTVDGPVVVTILQGSSRTPVGAVDERRLSELLSSTAYSTSSATPSTLSSSPSDVFYATIANLTDQYSTGSLHLTIAEGAYSLTEIEDIDPLEIGTLLGNFGGFWELVLLAWGVFYIARYNDAEPTLKARNFAKTFQGGSSQLSRKKRKLDAGSAQSPPASSVHDERHHNLGNAVRASSISSTDGPLNSGRHNDDSGSASRASFRRPVDHDLPMRGPISPRSSSDVRASGASGGLPGASTERLKEEAVQA